MISKLLIQFSHERSGGTGRIAGSAPTGGVSVAGVPSRRLMFLFDSQMRLVDSKWSNADGSFDFVGLDKEQTFVVVARDDQSQFNAVIRDRVTPAPMP